MVDTGKELRKAYFSLLSGQVTVEGSAIPFVDEKLEVNINEHDTYVMFTSQDEEDVSNKKHFANETLIRLQIVNQRKATNTKEVVESVSNQILSKLFPTRTSWAVSLSSPLSLTYAKYLNGSYNPVEMTDNGFVISKILTIKNRIVQN
mgnify:CR=1 FL=1